MSKLHSVILYFVALKVWFFGYLYFFNPTGLEVAAVAVLEVLFAQWVIHLNDYFESERHKEAKR